MRFVTKERSPCPLRRSSFPQRSAGMPAQQPVSADIWTALAWCAGILIVAYALAMTTYRRKTA
jgi:hypothetical protein